MLAWIKPHFTPPRRGDEEQDRIARIVHILIIALVLIGLAAIAADLAIDYLIGIPSLVIGLVLGGVAWVLLRRGQVSVAALLGLLTVLAVVTVQLYLGQGIHDPTLIVYPVMVILAGLVFDRRSFVAFTVLALLSLGGIVAAELHGLVYEAFPGATSWYDFAIAALILILAAIGIRLLADDLTQSLAQARRELAERKRVEVELRDSEARYRTFIEQSTEGLTLIDEAGLVREWNHAQELISGRLQADVLGRPQWAVQYDMLPPELRKPDLQARWQAMIMDALQTGESALFNQQVDAILITPAGERRHIQQTIFPIKTEQHRRLGAMTLDITDRKQAAAALQESEQRFRAIFNSVNDAILVHDPITGAILDVNDRMCQMYGYSRDEANQLSIADISANVPPYTQVEAMQWINRAAQGEAVVFEWRGKTKTGRLFWTEVNMRQAMLGQRQRILVAVRDITWRKTAEAALRASEDRFRSLVQNASDVITVHQADGTITYESPSAARVLGYGPDGLIGQHPRALIHPDDIPLLNANWQEVVDQRNDGLPTELRFRRPDGEWLYLEVIGKNLLDDPGIGGVVVTARNVTDRKRAEAEREKLIGELENRNTELERFTYTVSHDLKAPLITIKGFLGFLEKDAQAGNLDRLKSDVTRINEAATRMERLLSELLGLSRIGRLMNPPQYISFEVLAREAADLVEGRLAARGVRLTIAPDLGDVYGDRARLVEVLQNLIDNAAKFMGDQLEPRIDIGVRASADGRVFFVKDNGLGIAPQHRERVFGLFDKLDPHSEGTGIGLALVRRIVEVHGGRIWVESDGLKQGATFCFTLAGPSTQAGGGVRHE